MHHLLPTQTHPLIQATCIKFNAHKMCIDTPKWNYQFQMLVESLLFQIEQCELCHDYVYVKSWCIRLFQIGVQGGLINWIIFIPSTLSPYNEIFTFLMHFKLIVYGLEDTWQYQVMYGVCLVVQLGLCQSFIAHMPIHFLDMPLSLRFLTKHIASSSSNINLQV